VYATGLCGQAELRHVAVAVLLRPVRTANVCPVCAAEDLRTVCAGKDVCSVFAEDLRTEDVCTEDLRPACREDLWTEALCAAAVLRPLCRLPAGRLRCAAGPAPGPRDGAGRGARGTG